MHLVHRVRSALIAAALACLTGWGGVASAAEREHERERGQPDTIHEAMTGSDSRDSHTHQHAPPVARYVAEGGAVFILDRSGPAALFRMAHSNEIWALRPTPGPGGDIIYKNDLDQPMLRISRLGGVTLFTLQKPMGAPAALDGEGTPFHAPVMNAQLLLHILISDSGRASHAANRLIPFNAESAPGSEFLIADAAGVATEALVQMSGFHEGRLLLDRVKSVRLAVGRRTEARFQHGEIVITLQPKQGLAGRPSSGRIAKAIVEGVD
jgi:hypothetical protein